MTKVKIYLLKSSGHRSRLPLLRLPARRFPRGLHFKPARLDMDRVATLTGKNKGGEIISQIKTLKLKYLTGLDRDPHLEPPLRASGADREALRHPHVHFPPHRPGLNSNFIFRRVFIFMGNSVCISVLVSEPPPRRRGGGEDRGAGGTRQGRDREQRKRHQPGILL